MYTFIFRALFPCGDELVCIIDDREDVWNFSPNLIHVKPYHFFQHTGDIHAPPGLSKCENDEKEGFDFTQLAQGTLLNVFLFTYGYDIQQVFKFVFSSITICSLAIEL